ncbi:MinD-like ATPase involved in chromosome partitioning or flagellar assembly [Asanoa hainanensis]|uniref:MinD-like ATPase involved in chromosome partitioning or flagellar assembly n=1 Tax=Asanoa hainanensis TaxID=560556 RepID=A0A239NGN5_9ACTN|nr:AAA family ATPase [Asanoa hainanensis]SNT53279.1 MinD-like ATPase involved in chromosome partitioning or flagellar assembly [Asanoa hainanensis]
MEGTETGWGRPAEPAPRWRALLDRALLGGRTGENSEVREARVAAPRAPVDRQEPPVVPVNGFQGRAVAPVSYPPERRYPAERESYQQPGYQPGYRESYVPPQETYEPVPESYAPAPVPRPPAQDSYEPTAYQAGGYYGGSGTDYSYGAGATGYTADRYTGDQFDGGDYAEKYTGGGYEGGYARTEPRLVEPPPPVSQPDPGGLEWRAPAPTETEVDRAVGVLRREFGSSRVIAFANPKGGVHKTTATVLAAATVGSVRGQGVLAWDDNELRGTLGLRAGSARHARTIRHLITNLAEVEAQHGYGLTEALDEFLRHASDGTYDVLAGEESPRFAQRLDQYTVRRVLELLRRTHDVICVDTGNNVESANWQTVLQAADQLVITTVPREDAAFTADWMLDLLYDVGMGDLATNAVTLLSCPTPGKSPMLDDLAAHFATRTRAVAVVPYDPALETGSSIEYQLLQPATRDAWLKAASVMLEPFAR